MNNVSVKDLVDELLQSDKFNLTAEQLDRFIQKPESNEASMGIYIPVYIKLNSLESFSTENNQSEILFVDEELLENDYPANGNLQLINNPLVPYARGKLTLPQIKTLLSLSSVELIEEDIKYEAMENNQETL